MMSHPRYSVSYALWQILFFFVICPLQRVDSFRVLQPGSSVPNGTYFRPYDRGFVGVYGEPGNYQRERINEGAFETSDQELFYEGVSPRQACPNMVGPFSDGNYYCSAREFGFCDRRSGTCFCNTGYQGIDCSECQDSYFKIGSHCYPKKLCPNDCSGAGTCNYNNGTCNCLPHRTGTSCDTLLCSIHSPLCVTCTIDECLQCSGGYYLSGDSSVCRSCYDFDPRCAGCIKEVGCTVCADSTLTSVRRSGYRVSDPALPEEENRREFSITLPFGTKSPESFADAENYFVCVGLDGTPLKDRSLTCSQGLNDDHEWSCVPYPESHKVCGHFGVFTLLYPNYAISERSNHIRMYVQRTGGGYGDVTINYYIKHYTTNDSDIVSTAAYTTMQQLSFTDGVVQRSFLISILDDNIVEEDEVFQVVLEVPEGGGSVGAQFRANVTILDDDKLLTSPKLTKSVENITTTTAGEEFTITISAITGSGQPQLLGGDLFFSLVENDLSSWVSPIDNGYSQRQSLRKRCRIVDRGDGSYNISSKLDEQGVFQLRTWHAFPRSIKGEYFYDAYFENIAVTRLDHAVNFTWGTGRLIPRGTDYISVRWSGAFMTKDPGYYRFKVEADDHARLWIDGDLLLDHFHERAVNMEPSRSILLPGKTLIEVVLEYREVNGDAYARFMWQPPGASKLDVVPQSNLYSLFEIDRSPVLVTVKSASTKASTTECYGEGLYSGVALHTSRFTICPRDEFGNLRDDDDDVRLKTEYFSSSFELLDDNGFNGLGSEFLQPYLLYNNNTHCFDGSFVPERAGIYRLNITFRSFPDDKPHHVLGSPFIVDVVADKSSGPHSDIWGLPNPLYAEAGFCYNFSIVMRDKAKNLRLLGGDNIQVYMFRVEYYNETLGIPYITQGSAGTSFPTYMPTTLATDKFLGDKVPDTFASLDVIRYGVVYDHQNGNYSVRICPVIAGIHEIHILLNGRGVSNQNHRVLDRYHSIEEPSGRGTYFGQYIDNSPYQLVVKHTQASVVSTTAEGSGLIHATVGVPAYFKITIRDPFDNVLRTSYRKPTIAVKVDRSPTALIHVWNYYNGSYLLEYTAQQAGTNAISVWVDGFQITGSPFLVPTHDGQTSAHYSYARGEGLHIGVTGKKSFFHLFSFDLSNNRKTGYEDVYVFSVAGANTLSGILQPCPSPRNPHHPICDPYDDLEGYYWGEFLPIYTGRIVVSIFLQVNSSFKSEISNSPFIATIYPSGPKAENTDIAGTLYDNIAGIPAFVYLQTRDYYDNKLISGGKNVELALLGVGVEWGTVLPFSVEQGFPNQFNYKGFYQGYPDYYGQVIDHQDGSYTVEYNIDRSGMYVLRLALAEEGLNATYFNGTTFGQLFDRSYDSPTFIQSLEGNDVNFGNSISWTGDIGGNVSHDGSRGRNTYYNMYRTRMEPVINVSNTRGISTYLNSSEGRNYNFREQYWSARWTGLITAPYPEVYKIILEIDDESTANLWIGGRGTHTNGSYVGEHVLNITLIDRVKESFYNFSDTKYREFLLDFVHYSGDAQLRIYWESLTTPYQMIPASAFSHWRNMSHFNLTIHPNDLCSRCSTAYGASLTRARVAVEQSFTIYGRDVYGNLLQRGGDVPSMFAIGENGVSFRGKVTDYGNSTYLVRYYPTQAGIFRMYVTIGCCPANKAVGYPSEIQQAGELLVQGSPFSLVIDPAPLKPSKSLSIGNGLSGSIAGETATFKILYRDIFNNPTVVVNASANIQLKVLFVDSKSGDIVVPVYYEVKAVTEHEIIVIYMHTKAGTYNMSVMLAFDEDQSRIKRFQHILSSPFNIIVSPASAAHNKTICRGLGMRQATLNSSTEASFEVQLFDGFGNKINFGGDRFYIRLVGDANYSMQSIHVVPLCTDTRNGRYVCKYRPLYRRFHHLHVKLLRNSIHNPGGSGLLAEYFTTFDGGNLDMQNLPIISRVDPKIAVSWPNGYYIPYDEYGTATNNSYVTSTNQVVQQIAQSIRWSGYLLAPRSDLYNISVEAENVHAQIFLDELLVYDASHISFKSSTKFVEVPTELQAGSAYAIRIIAKISNTIGSTNAAVSINLVWSTPTVPFHSISEFFLYPDAYEIPFSPFPVHVH